MAAWLGWFFDGLELHLYTLVALPFVAELLRVSASAPDASVKASLIQAAFLVEPTDEWRSEGRGRPAQLYRYAPRRRRGTRRSVRFDLIE